MEDAESASESNVGKPAEAVTAGTSIEIRNLTVRAGERTLLNAAACTFSAGEVVLLLGCSGVGKSVLLKILAGLIDASHAGIQYTGDIAFIAADGKRRGVSDASHQVSVVFQNFALLDELSPVQNVQIALDHAQIRRKDAKARATELLADLRVPTDRATAVLSGGQQQRLAIARAIAPNADVVLYDEPTSGLDARTAQQVADLIRETQQRYQRTSILVTHDYETLSRIADRIILLDHTKLRLVELPKEQWSDLPAALGTPPRAATDVIAHSWAERIKQACLIFLTRSGILVEEVLLLPFSLLPLWRSWRWGLRYTLYYMRLVAGPSACIYIGIAGMILGYVAQDFVFRYLPFRQFTEPLLTENLLNATGFSLFRFLVPILSTILIAARSGAAVAADVGSKVYGNQLDAMKTIGMNPARSLRTPILYAFLLGTPFLVLLSYAVAALTAAFAFLISHQDLGIAFWDAHFHKELVQPSSILYRGSAWLIAKLVCCGLGVAMISWRCGVAPKLSGAEISQGVTRTILWATLFVLFVHFVFSLFEFRAVV